MSGALSHLKVLDLSRVMAGPWAGQILADFGADVVKVERPGAGDDTRGWGPPFLKSEDGVETQESGYYLATNRGKKSITVNLGSPEGQKIIKRLAKDADIILENFKVGTLERFGLDYASIKKINPSIIYCSITGFGQTGPRKNQVAYDFLIQAMGGMMSITGEADGNPGAGPQKIGVPMVDLTTGMYGVIGVLAAVAKRDQTGEGEFIDMSMLDVQVNLLANQAMNHLLTGAVPKRHGNGHPNIMPQQVFSCKDGHIVLAVGNDGQFQRLAAVLEDEAMLNDERLTKNQGRVKHREELLSSLAAHFAKYSRADLLAKLDTAEVPAGPINSIKEAIEEPQIVSRGIVGELKHTLSGSVPQVFSPIRMTNSDYRPDSPPPLLGQDTDAVLSDIGFSSEEIEGLKKSGAI